MAKAFIIAALLAAVALAGGGGGDDPSVTLDGVLDLTPETFDEIVGKEAGVLVEFYAPWCGHCKSLVPEYAKVGKAVKAAKAPGKVAVAKVNAEAHGELGSRFGVSGFPTIKYFPAGSTTPEDYQGGRDASSFVSFLNSKTGAGLFIAKEVTAVTVLDSSNFDAIVNNKANNVLVEFYAPWCGHCKKLAPDYEVVAKTFAAEKNVIIANLNADEGKNKQFASRFDVTGFPTLKFFPAGEDRSGEEYEGGRTPEAFTEWINKKTDSKRIVGGDLAADAGQDSTLNALASKFAADPSAAIKADIDARVKELTGALFAHYGTYAGKIMADKTYVERELARLAKVLAGKASAARRDDMMIRRNILSAFQA